MVGRSFRSASHPAVVGPPISLGAPDGRRRPVGSDREPPVRIQKGAALTEPTPIFGPCSWLPSWTRRSSTLRVQQARPTLHGLSTVKRKASQERRALGQEDRVTLWIIEASTP